MHTIEPFYNWRNLYIADEDSLSPFYNREYSEFEYSTTIYEYYIHPQWDHFGSTTLFMKLLYVDYNSKFAILEFLGEWNDCLYNDIMYLKRDIIDVLLQNKISKFILIGENVLNFHHSDDSYYEEWFEDVEDLDGWIAMVNFRDHVVEEFEQANIDSYLLCGGELEELEWRTMAPKQLYNKINAYVQKRLGI
ncbi:MAG: hypothetical protein ACXITV_05985 [Luteibaculaceae bacterium]